MRRRLFTFFSALSLLLFVGVCVLWVRSYWRSDQIVVSHDHSSARQIVVLESATNGLNLMYGDLTRNMPQPPGRVWYQTFDESGPLKWGLTPAWGITPTRLHFVYIPLCWLAIAAILLPAWWLWTWHRRCQGRGTKLCPVCGYDLRATPDRCPECGAKPNAPAT